MFLRRIFTCSTHKLKYSGFFIESFSTRELSTFCAKGEQTEQGDAMHFVIVKNCAKGKRRERKEREKVKGGMKQKQDVAAETQDETVNGDYVPCFYSGA